MNFKLALNSDTYIDVYIVHDKINEHAMSYATSASNTIPQVGDHMEVYKDAGVLIGKVVKRLFRYNHARQIQEITLFVTVE